MDKFEKQFEDIDVQTQYMENAMSSTTTTTVPENQVDNLMQQVADEAGYEYHFIKLSKIIMISKIIIMSCKRITCQPFR